MGANKNKSAARVGSRASAIYYVYKRHFLVCKSQNICNYADDTLELGIVIRQLEDDCSVIVKLFHDDL